MLSRLPDSHSLAVPYVRPEFVARLKPKQDAGEFSIANPSCVLISNPPATHAEVLSITERFPEPYREASHVRDSQGPADW